MTEQKDEDCYMRETSQMDEGEFEKIEKEDIGGDEDHASDTGDGREDSKHLITPDLCDLADDLACSVCLHVAVQPTTLVCGHTSCRICLAQWYFSSKKKECPLCRQPYQGHPKINAHIRNMTSKLYPKELAEREKELAQNAETMDILWKYDKELAKGTYSKRNNCKAFCLGVVLAFSAVLVAYLAWYWQFSERNLLVMKPVQLWTSQDVANWLEDMPWASVYANSSIGNNIDGNMLLAMDEESLEQLMNVSESVHQRALLLAVNMLKEQRVKVPSTLWDYKALYPGRSLFLIHGLKEFPRATFIYMWLYFYDDMFLPFVAAATDSTDGVDNVSSSFILEDSISTVQWVYFLLSAAVLPQWLVIVLAYHFFPYNFFTSIFIITMAILSQTLEILDTIFVFRNTILEGRSVRTNYIMCLSFG
uniref:RING-type domain-containing protein n=1 Tax=Arion vulgaris TaxID=1028688 RepID=A0A0B7AKF3_9EUPU